MKEIQQLRRIAVQLGVSGTAIPIAETRLYKGGYGFVVLQAYVPITQNRCSPDTSPLCTVFRTTTDRFGNRKQFNNVRYNMLYVANVEIDNIKYMVFECPLPKAFTDTVGKLEMVFTYSEISKIMLIDGDVNDKGNVSSKAVSQMCSGIYSTEVYDSDIYETKLTNEEEAEKAVVDATGGLLSRYSKIASDVVSKIEQLEGSVDALLQPPDNSDADKVGTPSVSLTEDGRLKFSELKGEKGDTGEDPTARMQIREERERAKDSELQLQININAEKDRAEAAEKALDVQITKNTSDINGLRQDFTNADHFKGVFTTVEELKETTATPNDYAYITGGNIWVWENDEWTDSEKPVPDSLVPASTNVPLMDGEGEIGVSNNYARGDHRHPSDVTKADLSGAAFTGAVVAPNITATEHITAQGHVTAIQGMTSLGVVHAEGAISTNDNLTVQGKITGGSEFLGGGGFSANQGNVTVDNNATIGGNATIAGDILGSDSGTLRGGGFTSAFGNATLSGNLVVAGSIASRYFGGAVIDQGNITTTGVIHTDKQVHSTGVTSNDNVYVQANQNSSVMLIDKEGGYKASLQLVSDDDAVTVKLIAQDSEDKNKYVLTFPVKSGTIALGSGSSVGITVDGALSATSKNPVQNKVINQALTDLREYVDSKLANAGSGKKIFNEVY